MSQAIALQCESDAIYLNVRPLEMIIEELDTNSVPYAKVPPAEQKMGSWEIVLVFQSKEALEKYEKGELKAPWNAVEKEPAKKINPLKASKRAAGR